MRDAPKSHLVTENAGRLQGRTAVHLDAAAAERQRRDRALKASEIRYRRLFETAPYGILVLDAETGVVIDVNPCLCQMLGVNPGDLIEQPLWSVAAFKNAAVTKNHFRDLVREPHVRYDNLPLETTDGQIRHVDLVSTLFHADNKQFVQCIVHDVTERVKRERADGERAQEAIASRGKRAPRRSTDQETHDSETGLVNRWYLEETLPRELHRATRAKSPLTVTTLAFDAQQPPAMLREAGRVMREHLRKSDMASRISNQEFVLVLDSSPAATQERLNEICSAIQGLELFHGKERLEPPVIRTGIATAGRDGTTGPELLDAASAAARHAR
ncbi:MAG TPA: PAS domain S-box protein [Gemmatimonadales bacterium]|nr:PAS domain S-box protein [Gemmatimonadales bacterium]